MAIQGPIVGKIHVEAFNTMYGIYFDSKTKEIRRIVIPHADWHLFAFHRPRKGESVIYVPAGNNDELPDWENHVFNATGVVPPSREFNLPYYEFAKAA